MKKTFKGILALFLALALLCAAVPAASAQTTSNDGQTFYWDPDTEPWKSWLAHYYLDMSVIHFI